MKNLDIGLRGPKALNTGKDKQSFYEYHSWIIKCD